MHFLVLLISLALLVVGNNADVESGRKKNIVFILTDDQDQQMDSLKYMKHVQSLLMNEGTHYRRHYAPTALCCPARVSIMTGLLTHNHGVTSVNGVSSMLFAIVILLETDVLL
jgi:arylsulfatase A-like enzyme